jgi:hypothetical protein
MFSTLSIRRTYLLWFFQVIAKWYHLSHSHLSRSHSTHSIKFGKEFIPLFEEKIWESYKKFDYIFMWVYFFRCVLNGSVGSLNCGLAFQIASLPHSPHTQQNHNKLVLKTWILHNKFTHFRCCCRTCISWEENQLLIVSSIVSGINCAPAHSRITTSPHQYPHLTTSHCALPDNNKGPSCTVTPSRNRAIITNCA